MFGGINWILPMALIYLSNNSRQNTFIHLLYIMVDCEALAETEHNISLKVPSAWLRLVGAEIWTEYHKSLI